MVNGPLLEAAILGAEALAAWAITELRRHRRSRQVLEQRRVEALEDQATALISIAEDITDRSFDLEREPPPEPPSVIERLREKVSG